MPPNNRNPVKLARVNSLRTRRLVGPACTAELARFSRFAGTALPWLWACTTGAPSARENTDPVCSEQTASRCGIDSTLRVGLSEHRVLSGGIERRFLTQLPASACGHAAPVVFDLHGSGGTPEEQLALSGLGELADARGFILVAPEARDGRWNVPPVPDKPDDVQFIADALDALRGWSCVDTGRVYATGFSGGARMSSQLACDLSQRIAAVAAIGGVRFPAGCAAGPVPILAFHGTADEVNPYAGGGQSYWGTGVEPAIDGWAAHNACPRRMETSVSPLVDLISYAGDACTEVSLYRIQGLGHTWPGDILAAPEVDSPPAANPLAAVPARSANDILWNFLERHRLGAGP
jgi:polyhydroxybutyrate depolymerase